MSDLYLVLRSRLESVAEWVYIDTAVLRQARDRKGLSYEAMGRLLNVASKTYERYEKAGRVPPQLVARVAEVLDLEIEEPARVYVSTAGERTPELRGAEREILGKMDELIGMVTAIDRRLDIAPTREEVEQLYAEIKALRIASTT